MLGFSSIAGLPLATAPGASLSTVSISETGNAFDVVNSSWIAKGPLGLMFAERVRVSTPTTGTGSISLGAAVEGFRTFGQALLDSQLVSGCSVYYAIDDGITWETGTGIYTDSATDTLSRGLAESSTGALLSLSGNAFVAIVLTAAFATLIQNAAPSVNPTFTGLVTSSGTITFRDGGTSPMLLSFAAAGTTLPSFTTRSSGTNLVLWSAISPTSVDYAIGVASNLQWASVPTNASQFVWYADTTPIAVLTGSGLWTFNGGIDQSIIGASIPAAGTFTSLHVPTPPSGTSTKAVATTAFIAPSVNNTGRNRVQNAGFLVSVRGASFTNLNTIYTCDRWIGFSTVSTATVTRPSLSGYGPASYGCTITLPLSGSQQTAQIMQRVASSEAADLSGQTMTLSLYGSVVFGGSTTGYCTVGIETPSAKDNWSSTLTDNVYLPIPMYPTAARTQVSFVMPNVANGFQLILRVIGASGSGTISYTLSCVQLEVGAMATTFENKSILEDTIDCKYYCQQVAPSARATIAIGTGYNATQINFAVMRITPTATFLQAGITSANLADEQLLPSSASSAYYSILSSAPGDTYSIGANYLLSADL